jgi:chromosome segregation ATPase
MKQEKLHKQVRSLWRKASSYMIEPMASGDSRVGTAQSRVETAGSVESEASVSSFGFQDGGVLEGEENAVVLHNFHEAEDEDVHAALDQDHDHIEKLHTLFEQLDERNKEIEKLQADLERERVDNEEMKRQAENTIDPSVLNELESLRGEVASRDDKLAALKRAIRDKEEEVERMGGEKGELERALRDGQGRADGDYEQLLAMKKGMEASEKAGLLLKERVRELELAERAWNEQQKMMMQREKDLEREMEGILEAKKTAEWELQQLNEQIKGMGGGEAKRLLEKVAKQKQREFGKFGSMLAELARKREDNLLAVMKSYQWVHHVPQVTFNGVA